MRVTPVNDFRQDKLPYGYLSLATYSEDNLTQIFHLCEESFTDERKKQACISQYEGKSVPINYDTMLVGWENPALDTRKFITFQDRHEQTEFINHFAKKPSSDNWHAIAKNLENHTHPEPHTVKWAQSFLDIRSTQLDVNNWPAGAILDSEALTLLSPNPNFSLSKDLREKHDLRAVGYRPCNFTTQLRKTTQGQLTGYGQKVALLPYESLRHMFITLDTHWMRLDLPQDLVPYWRNLITIARINHGLVPHSPFSHDPAPCAFDPFNL